MGSPTGLPTKATHHGHVWTWDFFSDATVRGGALKRLRVSLRSSRLDNIAQPNYVPVKPRTHSPSDSEKWVSSLPADFVPDGYPCALAFEFLGFGLGKCLAGKQRLAGIVGAKAEGFLEPAVAFSEGKVPEWRAKFSDEGGHGKAGYISHSFPTLAILRGERVKGIEPSYAAWEAAVLPLNYTRV